MNLVNSLKDAEKGFLHKVFDLVTGTKRPRKESMDVNLEAVDQRAFGTGTSLGDRAQDIQKPLVRIHERQRRGGRINRTNVGQRITELSAASLRRRSPTRLPFVA